MSDGARDALDESELRAQGGELLADRSAMSLVTTGGETPAVADDGTVFDGSCFPELPPEQGGPSEGATPDEV
jgi:hypothetical protein